MKQSEIIEKIEGEMPIHEINPDNPWIWAMSKSGAKEVPDIGVRAKEMMKLIPANHTERKFTGGRDSISIIMTTYNSMNIMLPSIFSILKQTHSNLELIVVDDCSNDDTENSCHVSLHLVDSSSISYSLEIERVIEAKRSQELLATGNMAQDTSDSAVSAPAPLVAKESEVIKAQAQNGNDLSVIITVLEITNT